MDVRGFDECAAHASGRAQWEKDYPIRGLNFLIWDQRTTKKDTVCSGGIYVAEHGNCYKYRIMKQVCILVKFEKDPVKNTYSWVYTGGCFKNNEPVWYAWAEPDVKYNFHDIQFEVRQDHRESPPTDEDEEDEVDESTAEETDESDADAKSGKEKPAAKIKRERENLKSQRDSGSIKPEGFYLFYRIFIFIGGLALFLAVIATGILFYFIFHLIKGSANDTE